MATLSDLIRSERVLPGRLAHGQHGTVRLDASGRSTRERTANAVRSVLPDCTVVADGPHGCTVLLDESDAREWQATVGTGWHRRPWEHDDRRLLCDGLEGAAVVAGDRIRRALPSLRVRVASHGCVVVRSALSHKETP